MAAYYHAKLSFFLSDETELICGRLVTGAEKDRFHSLILEARRAWEREIEALKKTLAHLLQVVPEAARWTLLLEFPIPRRSRRIDAVLLADDLIFVVEFKTDTERFEQAAMAQVEDYALDLSDFHERSREKTLLPILVATDAPIPTESWAFDISRHVQQVQKANALTLAELLLRNYRTLHDPTRQPVDAEAWDNSPYRPVPTIIEAAELLFAEHNVKDIAHAHAEAKNLTRTSERLINAVRSAQQNTQKILCFVTGVPGSGKTLAGLNVVHNEELRQEGRPAGVFLSGNGPLVRIVSEALARDHSLRKKVPRLKSRREVLTFIQNAHEFFKEHIDRKPKEAPPDQVVVFDEAQRAWNVHKERQKWHRDFSEPEMMLQIMDRHPWAVVVALVGGGQEIYDGEAGLAEWGRAVVEKYPHWRILASPEAVHGGESVAGSLLFGSSGVHHNLTSLDDSLHLPVSIRSFRAELVASWVNAVLQGNSHAASTVVRKIPKFPVVLTRSLEELRRWLRKQTRGMRRAGLVASSGARRLRPFGLETSSGFTKGYPWEEWFLAPATDVRSSCWLEVAATEFQCQGLELDWAGVCWGDDLTRDPSTSAWSHREFRGSKWTMIRKPTDREYLINKYRVLLTRAREGLGVWVPHGCSEDPTRDPNLLDATAAYLMDCGLKEI